jgi:hypothetical protein
MWLEFDRDLPTSHHCACRGEATRGDKLNSNLLFQWT